ncbi:hypothetical protein F4802DRAFT_129540 [Xylaria palmicola]|nr:hypothetical protein F4802DRAFT_129540 [Xylaria palmicola]
MSTSGSALAQLKRFTLGSRSLFIKCVPAPRNFYERRAVLATLQKISQQSIQTFKRLQDNSSFIVVTTRPDAAEDLVHNSPLRRTLLSQDPGQDGGSTSAFDYDVSGPIATPANTFPADTAAAGPTPVSTDLGLAPKTFTLHIFPANAHHDHREEVRKNPLHGQWPGDGTTDTFISAALKRVIPSGALAPALRDWETGNQLTQEPGGFADNGAEGAASLLLGKKRHSSREAFVLERIRRRAAEQEIPKVMSSLVQFAEECRAKSSKAPSEPSEKGSSDQSPSS